MNIPKSEVQLLKTKTALITGSRGFVGNHLVKALDDLGINYKCIAHNNSSDKNSAPMIRSDTINNEHFDCMIHLAGMAHNQSANSQSSYAQFYEANVAYTKEMFDKALQAKVSRFIYISTIGVYGVYGSPEVISEGHDLNPVVDYAKTKLEGEELIKQLCLDNNMEFVILRPSLVYGEGAPGNLQRLQNICRKRLPLPLGLANEKRTMVSVNNLVSAILKCSYHSAAKNKIYNVADDSGVSARELCNYYRRGSGNGCFLIPIPKPFMKLLLALVGKRMLYSQVFCPINISNKKIKDDLLWEPLEKPSDFFQC
ncbi:NAD-dependent epimerase/dehydratase family protein [Kangiella sediminilitoris]|uniref:NAD-dependent epimerase/dehydratase family protein n=1 Tax=Kangiella sediminilitoris TaxID=1144748 RepID=UPI0014723562|nr:NAD-dependent epimerase/dehydratase family protein [Kangiella sediminilitoris]